MSCDQQKPHTSTVICSYINLKRRSRVTTVSSPHNVNYYSTSEQYLNLLWFWIGDIHAATFGGHGPFSWIIFQPGPESQVASPVAWLFRQDHTREALPRLCILLSVCAGGSPYYRYFSRDISSKFTRFCISEIDTYLVINYRAYLDLLWCHSFGYCSSLSKSDCTHACLSQRL